MIKFFPAYMSFAISMTFSVNSYAESNLNSIVENKEVSACRAKHNNIDSECLDSLSKQMEQKLNTVYQDKSNEILNFDYSQWWMGEAKQREEMKDAFVRSQELWLKYRQDYCKAAGTGAEGIDGYGVIALSCQINMGTRRIEEIRMIHPDLSDGCILLKLFFTDYY